ncbi:MAG: DUF2490 domain-containing protein [Planctomycetota bacterium]
MTILTRVKSVGRFNLTPVWLLAAVVLCACRGGLAHAEEGFEYWTTVGTSFYVGRGWNATIHELLKLGEDAQKFTYHHTDLGFVYTGLAGWVDLGFNYRHAYKRYASGNWLRERRPHINATFRSRLGSIIIADRSRIEYRDKDYARDQWRYSNKITLGLPYEFTKWRFSPFIADQFYVDLDSFHLNKNKIYSGVSFSPSKKIAAALQYVWDTDETYDKWRNTNIIWLQLRFYF